MIKIQKVTSHFKQYRTLYWGSTAIILCAYVGYKFGRMDELKNSKQAILRLEDALYYLAEQLADEYEGATVESIIREALT